MSRAPRRVARRPARARVIAAPVAAAKPGSPATASRRHAGPPSLARARDLGVETCGRIAAFWGFTRTMGRTFGLLYLSPEPLARPEIQRRLGVSVGNASMTLGALERWGVVHRTRIEGRRAEHYRAETDFWKMISRVLDERERREISTAVKLVDAARAHATKAGVASDPARQRDAAFVSDRLARLHDICALGQTLLDMLLGQLHLDVARFRDVLRVPTGPLEATAPSPPAS